MSNNQASYYGRKTGLKIEKLVWSSLICLNNFQRKLASYTCMGTSNWGLGKKIKIEQLAFFFLDFSEQFPWKLLPHRVEWAHQVVVWGGRMIRNVRHRHRWVEYTCSRSYIWLQFDCIHLSNPNSLVVAHSFSPSLERQRQVNLWVPDQPELFTYQITKWKLKSKQNYKLIH